MFLKQKKSKFTKNKEKKQKIIMVENNDDDDMFDLKKQQKKVQPKTAQETIPFSEVYENGIFRTNNTFSIIFRITNIDYRMLRDTEKNSVYDNYSHFINTLPTNINYQEFLMNSDFDFDKLHDALICSCGINASPQEQENNFSAEIFEAYCDIANELIDRTKNKASDRIFLGAISFTPSNKLEDISILFRYLTDINISLSAFGSGAVQLKPLEVFAVLHEFYHPTDNEPFLIPTNLWQHDVELKDYIVPAGFSFKSKENRNSKQVIMGTAYTRVLFAKRFDREIDDEFVLDILDNNYKIIVSKQIRKIDKMEADAILKTQMDDIEGKIEKRRENNAKRGTTYIPWRLREKEKEAEAMQEALAGTNCDLHEFGLFITLSAPSITALNDLTEFVKAKSRQHNVLLDVLVMQQEAGLNSCLPLGINYLNGNLNNSCSFLLTDAVSNFIPFSHNNYINAAGLLYGENMLTNSPIVIDRSEEMNANGFILGTSGSGKSMFLKRELISAMIKYPNDEFLVIDPENEYLPLVKYLDGERVILSPDSRTNINLFDTDINFTEDGSNFLALKSGFLMNFCEMAKGIKLSSKEGSVIDRCVKIIYKPFIAHNGDKDYLPTLEDFYKELQQQSEQEAQDIALDLELYVTGSFNNFSKKTNIEYNKRFIIFDIFQMGEQLRTVGLQVLLEIIWQRVVENKAKGIRTWLWCDEFSVMFLDSSGNETAKSGDFFQKVYTRIRKYGGAATAATQNITTVLQSKQAVAMLSNAEFVVLLQQKETDADKIKDIYKLSDNQAAFINKGLDGIGKGLIKLGNKLMPFDSTLPKDNLIYKICSTKFNEKQRNDLSNVTAPNIIAAQTEKNIILETEKNELLNRLKEIDNTLQGGA